MSRVILKVTVVLSLCVVVALTVPNVGAQSAASNKAFMLAGSHSIILASATDPNPDPITILSAPATIKTSSNGAITALLSMECSIWTSTPVTVTAVSGKGASQSVVTAHAAVEVWVEIDGKKAEPENVVYCDRTQSVGLKMENTCGCSLKNPDGTASSTTCTCEVTDTLTLDLFQATKNANSFNFYLGPLGTSIHSVEVKAQGKVECATNGVAGACPATILNSFLNAQTAAVIGKRSLILEEQQNWGSDR